MTVTELIERAEYLVEERYDNDIWYNFIDDVLHDLTPAAKVVAETTDNTTITDEEATITLTDVHEVINVSFKPTDGRKHVLRKLSSYDTVSTGYIRENNAVRLQGIPWSAGTTYITYYAMLERTASGDDFTINLPEQYHDVLLRGVCAKAMQKEEDADRKQDFYGEYLLGKHKMLAERTYEVEPWNAQIANAIRFGSDFK